MGARIVTAVVAVLLLLAATLFTVQEHQSAWRVRDGKIVTADLAPGLHAHLPLLERIVRIDADGYGTRAAGVDVTSSDGQAVMLELAVDWRVIDPQAYLAEFDANAAAASRRIEGDVATAARKQLAPKTLAQIAGLDDAAVFTPVIASMNETLKPLGIAVHSLDLQRVDLKEAAAELVQQRMQQGFQAQLAEEQARAGAEAQLLRAAADEQGAAIIATAQRDAQRIRGTGEAQAAGILARAWGANAEFAIFYRSLAAYRATLGREGDVLVLTPDGEFFKYLHDSARR